MMRKLMRKPMRKPMRGTFTHTDIRDGGGGKVRAIVADVTNIGILILLLLVIER